MNDNIQKEVITLPPFKRFCMTIGELPSSYVETMTYYEMVLWFTKYLGDTIIPTVNNNAEAVTELQNLFVELQTYVNNYFDNLDVQEEINNKLDEMATDGTLQEIIADYLNSKAIFGFDNVADMKSATNLIDGSYARTLGYYNKNDGGSALYKIRTITNDDVVDEKFIISMVNDTSLIAELITNNQEINILQIGGGLDLATSINYAISKNYKIIVPKGNYTLNNTININENNTILIIDGNINCDNLSTAIKITSNNNIIKLNGTITGALSNDNPITSLIQIGDYNHGSLRNNIYIHYGTGLLYGVLISPDNAKGVAYNYITFDNITSVYGIVLQGGNSGNNYINENSFTGGRLSCQYGIKTIKGTNQTDPYNGNKFFNIAIDNSAVECGIDLEFTSYNFFENFRLSEGLVGNYWIKLNNSNNNKFKTEYALALNKISLTNQTSSNGKNFFDCAFIVDGSDRYVGYKAESYKDKFIIPKNYLLRPELVYLGGNNGEFTNVPEYYYENMTVQVGSYNDIEQTLTYTLPDTISKRNIKSFILKVNRKYENTTILIKDDENRTITVPSGYLNNVYYKVELINDATGYIRWIVNQIAS